MSLAMAADPTTLDPALAERERVLRILHQQAPRLRARHHAPAPWRAAKPGPRATSTF